jgi:hypothetical protein
VSKGGGGGGGGRECGVTSGTSRGGSFLGLPLAILEGSVTAEPMKTGRGGGKEPALESLSE